MSSRTKHILVVDDEPLAAQQVARFLERADVRTSIANSGRAAIECDRADAADLIVTDLRMPDGDGVELIRMIRGRDPDRPIIVVTGQVLREAEAEALEAGASELLRKPLDLHELSAAVGRLLPSG